MKLNNKNNLGIMDTVKNAIGSNKNINAKVSNKYIDAKNYFENENNISNILKSREITAFFHGYLVNKEWVDKWKNYSSYDYIKKNSFKIIHNQ